MTIKPAWKALAALVVLAGIWIGWSRFGPSPLGPTVAVAGGDGGGMPRSQPSEEHFDPALLDRISADPVAAGLRALVILRHGHVVYERYGHGDDADTLIDSGGFARALLALSAGVAAQSKAVPYQLLNRFDADKLRAGIEQGTHQSYPDYLSHSIWSRLNAAAAMILLPAPGAAAPGDCCLRARLMDWMRVAALMLDDGRFEDTDIVPHGWTARMMQSSSPQDSSGFGIELARSAHGAAPFAARGVAFLRGPGHWRLWVVPDLDLAVLFGAPGEAAQSSESSSNWDETRIPNLVIGSISDPPAAPSTGTRLQQLVPGH